MASCLTAGRSSVRSRLYLVDRGWRFIKIWHRLWCLCICIRIKREKIKSVNRVQHLEPSCSLGVMNLAGSAVTCGIKGGITYVLEEPQRVRAEGDARGGIQE